MRELDVPVELYERKTYPFEFSTVEMPYESYNGVNVSFHIEEIDRQKDQHQKKDSKYHGTMNDEDEESLKKGNHIGEDLKAGKNSKKEMKEWDGKKDDGRGIKTIDDRKGKHIYGSVSYDSANSVRHEGRGNYHGGVPTLHDFEDDFDTNSRKIMRKTSNK
ncbi:uncharacterized protein A4U43_C03F18100 [Asparagus officinalis]|uniref:Uncharacterized protein n=1 Tax=Asparagus officinalis TaxID=4686 RepID=A0A5P1FCT0_ASPOF|nr:uncharacterized protein A4U43_C03F18100 [Asparagus officinalis]